MTGYDESIVKEALERWAQRISRSSGGNLLFYRNLKWGTLELTDTDAAVLSNLLKGETVELDALFSSDLSEPSESDEHTEPTQGIPDHVRCARRIHRRTRQYLEEKGINTLFLMAGTATWRPPRGSRSVPRAPVLLCPAVLKPSSPNSTRFRVEVSDDWALNEELARHLSEEFGLGDLSGLQDDYTVPRFVHLDGVLNELKARARHASVPGFTTKAEVLLGNLSYAKMPLVNDLRTNTRAYAQHRMIAALAGEPTAIGELQSELSVAGTGLDGRKDDKFGGPGLDRVKPSEEHLVLDADASQHAAVNAAVAGRSFLLHGPPGTGKSQTIANIIAAVTAAGRSVLFVAEKSAAIDAVAKRLREVGLGDYLMDVHGRNSGVQSVRDQINRALSAPKKAIADPSHQLHRMLAENRDTLVEYCRVLHSPRPPWGVSLFEAQVDLAGLADLPEPKLTLSHRVLKGLDREALNSSSTHLRKWADMGRSLEGSPSRWKDAELSSPEDEDEALELIREMTAVRTNQSRDELTKAYTEVRPGFAGTLDNCEPLADLLERVEDSLDDEYQRKLFEGGAEEAGHALDDLLTGDGAEDYGVLVDVLTGFGIQNPSLGICEHLEGWFEEMEALVHRLESDIPSEAAGALVEAALRDDGNVKDLRPALEQMKESGNTDVDALSSAIEAVNRGAAVTVEACRALDNLDSLLTRCGELIFSKEVTVAAGVIRNQLGSLAGNCLKPPRRELRQARKLIRKAYKPKCAPRRKALQEMLSDADEAERVRRAWDATGFSGLPSLGNFRAGDKFRDALDRQETCDRLLQKHAPLRTVTNPFTVDRLHDHGYRVLAVLVEADQLSRRWTESGFDGKPQWPARLEPDRQASVAGWLRQVISRFREGIGPVARWLPAELDTEQASLASLRSHFENLAERCENAQRIKADWRIAGFSGSPRTFGMGSDRIRRNISYHRQLTERLAAWLPSLDTGSTPLTEIIRTVETLKAEERLAATAWQVREQETWLREGGFSGALDHLSAHDHLKEHATKLLEHAWNEAIVSDARRREPVLVELSADPRKHDEVAAHYACLDRAHITGSAQRVIRLLAERSVRAQDDHPSQKWALSRELTKRRRRKPLRSLLAENSQVLLAVKPCWMMSPLDVSRLMPADRLFDLVVFDEASQVPPGDAVPPILRGSSLVVVGDPKQLPPTTFFERDDNESGDDYSEDRPQDAIEGQESILNATLGLLPERHLRWHYRSQDERLIVFANRQIYNGELVSFPSVTGDDCLHFEHVPHCAEAVRDTKSNSDEVRRVVDLMIEHARERPDQTLGVVAMGLHHAGRIEEALFARLNAPASNREALRFFLESEGREPYFVKSLELVQGDERDAIILSVGYTKKPDGTMRYQFGPLNQKEGRRRLNVAVTRARRRMTLVSSFTHEEMGNLDRFDSDSAVRMLRDYLEYMSSGGVAQPDSAADEHPMNSFERDVYRKLTEAGLSLVAQYGVSGYRIDFAIRHPKDPTRFVLAVETDGATYQSGRCGRERDRLRQEHLERLGWRFLRIWSTNWFDNPVLEVQRVLEHVREAVAVSDHGYTKPMGESDWGRTGRTTPAKAFPRRGLRPILPHGPPIGKYSNYMLDRLVEWIRSDGLLRTKDEISAEMRKELSFTRRGSRIDAAFNAAIERYQAKKRRRNTP